MRVADGSRYGDDLFKVAAILLVIPLLSIVSPILVLIGISRVKNKFSFESSPVL